MSGWIEQKESHDVSPEVYIHAEGLVNSQNL